MERLPDDTPDDAADAADTAAAELARAARAFHDAVVLACYDRDADADAPRTRALLGNVRTTASEYARLLARGDRDPPQVREAVRGVVWRALSASGCPVDALRPVVDTLGPLLDLD